MLVSRATGMRLHVPVWLRVLPPVDKDVLLIDDDGSPGGGRADYRATYTAMLDSLGLTYDVFGFTTTFPSVVNLHRYRSIIVFTGDNASFNDGWVLPGAITMPSPSTSTAAAGSGRSARTGRSPRTAAPSTRGSIAAGSRAATSGLRSSRTARTGRLHRRMPTALGCGPFAGTTLGLSQSSIDLYSPIPDTDTYASQHTTKPLFRQIGSCTAPAPAGSPSAGPRSRASRRSGRSTSTGRSRWASASRGWRAVPPRRS